MPFLYSCLYCMSLGLLSTVFGELLPRKWFKWERFPFRSWKWEKNGEIYDVIRIHSWKDHMPDMSRVVKFMVPKKVGICPTSEEVRILIRETCVAETVHFLLCCCAPVIYLFWHNGIGIFIACLYAAFNLPFIMIQRYNRPALVALAERLEARERRRLARMNADTAEKAETVPTN